MKKRVISLALSAMLLLSGCQGLGEDGVGHRAVAQILAVDTLEDGVEVAIRLLADADGGYVTVSQQGENISQARSEAQRKLGKQIFLRDVGLIVLGEEVCTGGIGLLQQYLYRNFQLRPRVSLLAVQGQAAEYLRQNEDAQAPIDAVAQQVQWPWENPEEGVTVMALQRELDDTGGDGYLPVASLSAEGKAELSGGLILHREKASRQLGREAWDGLRLLVQEPVSMVLTVPTDQGDGAVELLSCSGGLQASLEEQRPVFLVSRTYRFRLLEWSGRERPDQEALEQALSRQLEQILGNAIRETVYDTGADVMQLDSALRRDQPRWWQTHGEGWKDHRQDSGFWLSVECQVEIPQQ